MKSQYDFFHVVQHGQAINIRGNRCYESRIVLLSNNIYMIIHIDVKQLFRTTRMGGVKADIYRIEE